MLSSATVAIYVLEILRLKAKEAMLVLKVRHLFMEYGDAIEKSRY